MKIKVILFLSASAVSLHSAPYVGLGVGYITTHSKMSRINTSTAVPLEDRNCISGQGILGRISAGYEASVNEKTVIAPEIFYDYSGVSAKYNANITTVTRRVIKTKMQQKFGGSIKLGYKFNEITPFLRLGVENATWKIKSESTITPILAKKKKKSPGICFGLGVDYAITQKTSFVVDFTHSNYKKTKLIHVDSADLKFKNNANTLMMGLKISF